MKMRLPAVIFFFSFVFTATGQQIFISRYIPGNYLINNLHRVDIFNPSLSPRDISGYLLVTRNYSLRVPRGSVIGPRSGFSFARYSSPLGKVDVQLSKTPDFLIRFPDPELPGNYVLLFDRKMNPVDGMYFSPQAGVSFLPDEGSTITFRGDTIPFRAFDESDKFWINRRINLVEDPAVGFIQLTGNWIPTGIRTNLLPATSFPAPVAGWFEGIVSLDFTTRFEENCFFHHIERSEDNQNFYEIGTVQARGTAARGSVYEYYDPGTTPGRKYYYRLRNRDIYGNDIFSPPTEVFAGESASDFFLDVFQARETHSPEINIRFLSRASREIKITLVSENFRVEQQLFSGMVESDRQNLVKLPGALPRAKYLVVAETNEKRYFRELLVE